MAVVCTVMLFIVYRTAKYQYYEEEVTVYSDRNLLAVPVGITQKDNVDAMVQKILISEFFPRWFAKRFLHPDIVSVYDYIFLWDEDLGLEHFSPSRYIEIVKEEGLEISQPALDPDSTDIHHRITVRARTKKVHRFVEGMAPVFSRSAWYCAWHLIQIKIDHTICNLTFSFSQNDLVHGWGMDMKLGYCAQRHHSGALDMRTEQRGSKKRPEKDMVKTVKVVQNQWQSV
ncbi:hypothetical protein TanjilG_20846 [Lupinus angustifolius]|uniref:Uncharacterized protein n=1 Tax=Lupinus angustifolius TaxID=3871 RepID=A0A4P1QS79_LUPAN|nr:hypothetical protein TanjilG_20846 [Lupinus angustifolius]